MPKVNVGVACHKVTKRWHIIIVREGDTSGDCTTADELSFATKEEALDELNRQIKTCGYDYEYMQ